MNLFPRRKDDFADLATDPVRRQAAIVDLTRRSRMIGWTALLFILVTLMLVWDQRVGAVCTGLFAALLFSYGARLEADVHLLEVLKTMGSRYETRMG